MEWVDMRDLGSRALRRKSSSLFLGTMKTSKYKISEKLYRCECGKEFDNPQSLNAHFSHCLIHKEKTGQSLILIKRGKNFKDWDKNDLLKIVQKGCKTIKEKYKNGELKPCFKGKKHTEETKEKIRKKRVEYLSDGKQHGAFDKSKKTYLEQWFEDFLLESKLSDKYNIKYNYSVYPYFLDFAFLDLKLDVEVDGRFHYIYDENIEHDKKRNQKLEKSGWRIYRISIDEVNKNPDLVKKEFITYLSTYSSKSVSRYYNF